MRAMRLVGAAYVASSIAGAAVAIERDEPAAFAGVHLGGSSVARGFLIGSGTALSPPAAMIVGLIALLRARFRSPALRIAGAMFAVGQLGEPITWRTLRAPSRDPLVTTIVAANIVFPLVMAAGR